MQDSVLNVQDITKNIFMFAFKCFQITLFFFFLILSTVMTYSFFYDVCLLNYVIKQSKVSTLFLILIGLILSFNVIFNYLMSVFTKPGGTEHLKHLVGYLKNKRGGVSLNDNTDPFNSDEEDLENNYLIKGKACLKCESYKPLRSHHCSVCNSCVLRMDHHCPWICNCVGHKNHRYFLLMLFYLTISTGVYALTSLSLVLDSDYHIYKKYKSNMFGTLFLLSIILFFVLVPFSAWNWYLAVTGQTAIEFWGRRTQATFHKAGINDLDSKTFDYRQKHKIKNLTYIFGTSNLFEMLLPSIRDLDHEGVDWEAYINTQNDLQENKNRL